MLPSHAIVTSEKVDEPEMIVSVVEAIIVVVDVVCVTVVAIAEKEVVVVTNGEVVVVVVDIIVGIFDIDVVAKVVLVALCPNTIKMHALEDIGLNQFKK